MEQARLTLRGSGALGGMAADPSLPSCLRGNLGWRHINLQVDLSGASVEPPRQTEDAQPSGMLRGDIDCTPISIPQLSLVSPQRPPEGIEICQGDLVGVGPLGV